MKIGVSLPSQELPSVLTLARFILESASRFDQLVWLPPDYVYSTKDGKRVMAESFIRQCDAIVSMGLPADLLVARQRLASNVPFTVFLLGSLTKGAWDVRDGLRYLTTNDRFVVNCSSDVQLLRKFLTPAAVSVLPFPFDGNVFFPLDISERLELRKRHGFSPEDRIIVYAGRGMVSKNIHALLRVFKALVDIVPNVHLVLAGGVQRQSGIFGEVGVIPLHFPETVHRLIDKLCLPKERLHLLEHLEGDQLRELYNIADVKANLTLHYDENFGLSQVEAMASGTPVVGSAWGGLKDTIVDGTSGYKVSVTINSMGVRLHWWEAVNKIAWLLKNADAREALRDSCIRHANERYSPPVFGRGLTEVIVESVRSAEACPLPLKATPFAEEYWETCNEKQGALYRHGYRSFELYTELMSAYCGSAPEDMSPDEPLADQQVLCLSWPIECDKNGIYRVNDPRYPFDLNIPPDYFDTFRAVIGVMERIPAITVSELRGCVASRSNFNEVLAWMLSVVVLRSRPVQGWITPQDIKEQLGQSLFRIQKVDRDAVDFIVIAGSLLGGPTFVSAGGTCDRPVDRSVSH